MSRLFAEPANQLGGGDCTRLPLVPAQHRGGGPDAARL